ncbi:putative nuclease HARBI1 [Sphaeramia orbicularis]|uniref:putative nuclease HARBI1 n=1 Tax=Sphaeramia orbicularis TaxID=375764 RepID=UPI0011805BD9|nr:putative nuclease HARBI1 [Sphaeramia orbicularis]
MAVVVVSRRRRRYDERRRRKRIFHPRVNTFGMNEETLIKRYRLSSFAILELLDEIKADLEPATRRSQRTVAITAGISQSRFSDVLSEVLNAMLRRMVKFIRFPHTQNSLNETKQGFFAVAGFPGVIGATDCTHVQLVPPQTLSMCIITNVVAKYPGSVHDSYILRNSALFSKLRDGEFGDGWLVGDSAYPLHPFLLTPVLNPTTAAENRYNEAHIRTRNVMERTFGILKSRFHCLDRTGGALLYRPEKVAQIVVTCCMLHNITKLHGLEHDAMPEDNVGLSLRMEQQPNAAGTQTRTSLIQSHFL